MTDEDQKFLREVRYLASISLSINAREAARLLKMLEEERALYNSAIAGFAPGYGPAERFLQQARRELYGEE
jgi:hypothetical protein